MNRTRIKVCGMTEASQVEVAVKLGVDAIGVILHAESPRTISIQRAKSIRKVVPEFVSLVGVFVDAPVHTVSEYREEIGLDIIQYHGGETKEDIESLGYRHIKAIRASSAEQVANTVREFSDTRTFLLDPFVEGKHGGTGQLLDESVWPSLNNPKVNLVLAGGLSELNVRDRVKKLRPFAVDVNSGIEDRPGYKNTGRLTEFVRQVRSIDVKLKL